MPGREHHPLPKVRLRRDGEGALVLQAEEALAPRPRVLTERLVKGAKAHPGRVLLAERQGDGWASVGWSDGLDRVLGLAQALLDLGVTAERPLAILSAGSVGHGLLALAATHVGLAYSPMSPGWSLLASDHEKLDFALSLITPGLIYVEDRTAFAFALKAPRAQGIPVIDRNDLVGLAATPVTEAVARAHAAIRDEDCRSILFTSGSTGAPKGVINTHGMICSNVVAMAQTFPALRQAPELVSWLPWHHTSGANVILSTVILNGGSLYVDDGKPVPSAMPRTLENLRGISPVAYFSAPSGFGLLAGGLEADPELADSFFRRLEFFFYSGASLPAPVAERMDRVARRLAGRPVPFFSCYGSTEMSPFALAVSWPDIRSGLAGLPMPGVELKLAPVNGLQEARVRGAGITPGYWRNPEATASAFDADGFFCSGDAMCLVDQNDPSQGLLFDGRIGENFKLATGTWVNVAGLREALITRAGGLIRDAVIAGEGRDQPGALIYVDPAEADPRAALARILSAMASEGTGSSTYVARVLILDRLPDPASGEVTDKGSIASRLFLKTRAADVARLFSDNDPDVITAAG